MKGFPTSEEYFVAQDCFVSYVIDTVNPARVGAGLRPVNDADAREYFRMVHSFCEEWEKRCAEARHPDGRRKGTSPLTADNLAARIAGSPPQ